MQYEVLQAGSQLALAIGTIAIQLAALQMSTLAEPLPTLVQAVEEAKAVECLPLNKLPEGSNPSESPLRRAVTVRIETRGKNNNLDVGSGVIIRREDPTSENELYTYTVLTADHVVASSKWARLNIFAPNFPEELKKNSSLTYLNASVNLFTCDGQKVELKTSSGKVNVLATRLRENAGADEGGVDLALLVFESSKRYPVATLANQFVAQLGEATSINGWPNLIDKTGVIPERLSQGRVDAYDRLDLIGRPNVNGYTLFFYRADPSPLGGMSGGPVFNSDDLVIGIYGRGEEARRYPTTVIKSQVIPEGDEAGLSAAIPITTLTNQLTAKIGTPGGGRTNLLISTRVSQPLKEFLQKRATAASATDEDLKKGCEEAGKTAEATAEACHGYGLLLLDPKNSNSREAITAFTQAINLSPNYVEAYVSRGDVSIASSRTANQNERLKYEDKALADYQQAVKISEATNNPSTGLYLRLARLLARRSFDQEAEKYFEKAVKLSPSDPSILVQQGSFFYRRDRFEAAKQSWNQAVNISTEQVSTNSAIAATLYLINKNNSQDEALVYWAKALEPDSDGYTNLEALRAVAASMYGLGVRDQGVNFFEELQERAGRVVENKPLLYRKGLKREFEKAIRQFTNTPEKPEEVLARLNEVVTINPDNPEGYVDVGNYYSEQRRWQEAVDKYTQAIQRLKQKISLSPNEQPDNRIVKKRTAEIYQKRAESYTRLGSNKLALEDQKESNVLTMQAYAQQPQGNGGEQKPELPVNLSSAEFFCLPSAQETRRPQGNVPLIRWRSTTFASWGYSPETRCQQITARLEQYKTTLRQEPERITHGLMNKRPVLCLAPTVIAARQRNCPAGSVLLLNLEPNESNSEAVLTEFKVGIQKFLQSSPDFAGPTLTKVKELPKPQTDSAKPFVKSSIAKPELAPKPEFSK